MAFGLDDLAMILLTQAPNLISAFGGRGKPSTEAAVPPDLGPFRQQFIDFLTKSFGDPGFAMNFFGGPQSDLQRQTRGGISQFLNQPAPEMQAFNTARPALEGMLTGRGPQFDADIAAANQTGDRFSSGNAIMRGEAFRHLYNQRTQAAGTLGTLASAAGQNPFSRMLVGGQFANQDQQMRMKLMQMLFGGGRQAALGHASYQQPSRGASAGQAFGDIGQLLMLFKMLGGGGQQGGPVNMPGLNNIGNPGVDFAANMPLG